MNLYNKYRPQSLQQIKGNFSLIQALTSKCQHKKDIPHVILLTGPKGCGKTTIGRIVAKEAGIIGKDLNEVNCADDTGIDPIRVINKQSHLSALSGDVRGWILDEVHRLTPQAQSALLKPLEDTPDHVYFFLCTTEPNKLLDTILSRCMRFDVEKLTEQQITMLLMRICKSEEKKVPKSVLEQIATDSLGHARDALVILEKIIDLPPDDMSIAAKKIATNQNTIIELCHALTKQQPWHSITKIINGIEEPPERVRHAVMQYCDSILSKKDDPLAYIILDCFDQRPFYSGRPALRRACYEALFSIKEEVGKPPF